MQAPQGAGESPPPRHRDGKIHPKTLTPPLCLLCAMPHFSLPAGKNLGAVPPETRVLLATASPARDRWPSREGPSIGTRISRPEPHAARGNRGPHRPTRAVEISLGYPIDHHKVPSTRRDTDRFSQPPTIPLAVVAYDPAQAEPSNMNGATAQGTEYLVRPTSHTLVDPTHQSFLNPFGRLNASSLCVPTRSFPISKLDPPPPSATRFNSAPRTPRMIRTGTAA